MLRPRRHSRHLPLVLAVFLGCACGHREAAEGPVVRSFELEGASQVPEKDIRRGLFTQKTPWWPLARDRRLDEDAWRGDLRRIERYYRARGYYQATVLDARVEPLEKDGVRLFVQVREGQPTRVTRLDLTGLEDLPPELRAQAERGLPLRPGDIFEEEAWDLLRESLAARLRELGYAEAKVEGEAGVDLATREAVLRVAASPGVRYRPGAVEVLQAPKARVEAWRVEEQVAEALEPYRWFTPEAQREAQARIFVLGVFGAARVEPGEGDPETGLLPVRVEVVESSFHEVSVGFGLGFEQLRQEGRVSAGYVNRDFLGGLRRLDLQARAGWAFIPNAYTAVRGEGAVIKSGPMGRLRVGLDQPRLFHPNIALRTRTEVERAVEPAYTYTGGAARLGVVWRPRTWFLIEPSYNLEVYRLSEGETGLRGEAPELLFGCEGSCVLSYLEQRLTFDRRDHPQEPTSGFYLALALQQGGGPLGGSFRYLRFVPEARAYRSLRRDRRLTLAGRVKVGTLIPLGAADDESPVVARFFSGGDGMRGFSTQRLSPMRLVERTRPVDEFTADPMPVGGNGLFEASVEARFRLTQPISAAVFVDAGLVTFERLRLEPLLKDLLWAVGGGIRYRTPVGPVRLDLAYRLPFGAPLPVFQLPGEDLLYRPHAGCFGLGTSSPQRGGAPEGVCSLHLSIGEAF